MKKLLVLVCALWAALALECGAAAVWYEYDCGENVTARLESGVFTVSGTGPMTDYAGVEELPWHSLDAGSDLRQTITRVVVGEGVTSVGDYAFDGCRSLESVSLPQSLERIGAYAFCGDGKLTGLELPGGVREIGENAFLGDEGITEIRLPEGLERVEREAFGRTGITHVDVPEGVTRLLGFAGCARLKSVCLPDSVTELSFAGCRSLEACDVPSKVTRLEGAFNGCYALRRISLPEGLTEIGERTFYDCYSLTEVHFPESLESIGVYAFYGCSGITELRIPPNVKWLGTKCFEGCRVKRVIYESEDVTGMTVEYAPFQSCGLRWVYFAGGSDRWNPRCIEGYFQTLPRVFYNSLGPAEADLTVRDGALAGGVFVPMKDPGAVSRCFAVCTVGYGRLLDAAECAVETVDGGLRMSLSMRPEGTEGARLVKLLFLDGELRPVHSAAELEDSV